MAYLGKTIERNMYYGARKDVILFARELRKNMTKAEEVLWSRLRKKQVEGFIFRRQHPIDIYIVDFYCHELNLIIEVDGNIHDLPEISEHDEGRTAELEILGLDVIRFTNQEVIHQTDFTIEKIKLILKVCAFPFRQLAEEGLGVGQNEAECFRRLYYCSKIIDI